MSGNEVHTTVESPMDPVGSELLFANERVRVWEMRLAPGETYVAHRHHNDYLMLYPDPAVGRSTSRSTTEHVETGFVAFATVGTQGLPPHQITNLGDEPVTHYVHRAPRPLGRRDGPAARAQRPHPVEPHDQQTPGGKPQR